MTFVIAKPRHVEDIKYIVHHTIEKTFPAYYSDSVVDFFQNQHDDDTIRAAVSANHVYLIREDGQFVATASVRGNEIYRLFVLPEHQDKDYYGNMLNFLEKMILREFSVVYLDSYTPANIALYQSRGYVPLEQHRILTADGEIICYEVMGLKK